MTVRHLDLFAGIGGFSRAVEWIGGETVGFVEWDAWNRRVLAKHWPEARYFGDITTVTDDDLRSLGRIDLITGGYPCQPFSLAGKRRGHEDDRHLWPEMRRVINTLRPRFVLAENVAGHISMGLDTVLDDMEADGYTCGAIVVPAGAVNALHRRDRVWIMAHADESCYREAGAGIWRQHRQRGPEEPHPDSDAGQRELTDETIRTGRDATCDVCAPESVAHTGNNGPQAESQSISHQPQYAAVRDGDESPSLADTQVKPERKPVDETNTLPGEGGARTVSVIRGDARRRDTRAAGEGQAPRPLDTRPDGIRPGLVRRSATGPADGRTAQPASYHASPDMIRAAWADGSWELDLPRVVTDEPERRQKLMAAGNAIVPLVAYELLSAMLGDT